ncbi:MAG: 1-(5-phosphoribosyl)-5-[(5-phosphoribosylamino)methylideneamino]imidazole-4-carboxamide isomerase [Pelagibacteraceae bacterium]|nr:1-(5-phosphoribosyl)-5-[(5-phosphoribosylamino)methylideneamino]imidazole-4-carboxamide isomerase [Pelagibacteraceae bacterium]
MDIIPAIDLKNKKCVRLYKGKYEKSVTYNEDPIQQAKEFEKMGFKKIHIIDIDAATNNPSKNKDVITQIKNKISMEIQLGGGIRSNDQIKFWFERGIDNLIIGSMATEQPKILTESINEFPNKILVAIDDKNDMPMIAGWSKESNMDKTSLIKFYDEKKIKGYVFTDVNRDGTLLGLNIEKIKIFVNKTKHNVIVGGGVKDMQDINGLKLLKIKNIEGVIVGKAYYNQTIDLSKIFINKQDA